MLTVNVIATDIQKGLQGNANQCAVARAIRRAIKTEEPVTVEAETVTIGDNLYTLPKKVQTFVHWFDVKRSIVKPLSFRIKYIPPAPSSTKDQRSNWRW